MQPHLELVRGAGDGALAAEVAEVARRFIEAWAAPDVDRFVSLLI